MSLVRITNSETTRTAKAACRGGLFCARYIGGSRTNQHKPMVSELNIWRDG